MPSQALFIDIFAFNLRKITKTTQVTTPSGAIGIRLTTEKDNVKFEEFFKVLDGQTYEEKFQHFISEFIGNFNSHYVIKRDKGVSLHKKQMISIHSKKFFIWGEFSGGHTGREQRVYSRDNSTSSDYTISKEKMVASPFFYLIWIPKDSNLV